MLYTIEVGSSEKVLVLERAETTLKGDVGFVRRTNLEILEDNSGKRRVNLTCARVGSLLLNFCKVRIVFNLLTDNFSDGKIVH